MDPVGATLPGELLGAKDGAVLGRKVPLLLGALDGAPDKALVGAPDGVGKLLGWELGGAVGPSDGK